MKTLQTIQKTCNVFRILTGVAFAFCVVGAVLSGVGALCAVVQWHGGTIFSLFGEPIRLFAEGTDLARKSAELLARTFMLTAEAILFALTRGCLKAELADGTPFTRSGADRLRKLGIRFIYIPIIAVSVSAVVAVWQGVENLGGVSNFGSLVTGIVMIFVSLILRYGAELESR